MFPEGGQYKETSKILRLISANTLTASDQYDLAGEVRDIAVGGKHHLGDLGCGNSLI